MGDIMEVIRGQLLRWPHMTSRMCPGKALDSHENAGRDGDVVERSSSVDRGHLDGRSIDAVPTTSEGWPEKLLDILPDIRIIPLLTSDQISHPDFNKTPSSPFTGMCTWGP